MAAPMVMFCGRICRAVISRKCSYCRILATHISSSGIHTDHTNYGKVGDPANRSARRLKNFLSKRKSFKFEASDQLELVKPPPRLTPSTKGRQVPPHASIRLKTYNTIVFEHLRGIINSDIISQELQELQVEIAAVRYTGDMSTCRVFWRATGTAQEDNRIQTILCRYAPKIRSYMISLRLLAKIPQLCFLTDKGAANAAQVEQLLSIADFGPEDFKIPSADDEDNDQELEVKLADDMLVCADDKIVSDSDASMQDSLFGIDHSVIHKQIQMHKEQMAVGGQFGDDNVKKDSVDDLSKNFEEFYKDIKKRKNKKSKSTMRREAKMYNGELEDLDKEFDFDKLDREEPWDEDGETDYETEYDEFHDYEKDYRIS